MKKSPVKSYLCAFMSLIVFIMVALIVLSVMFVNTISLFLYVATTSSVNPQTHSDGAELCEDVVVLLRNKEYALLVDEAEIKKVNVFGCVVYNWMPSAFSSGFSNNSLKKVKLFPALEAAVIGYNTMLYDMYKNFYLATSIDSRN